MPEENVVNTTPDPVTADVAAEPVVADPNAEKIRELQDKVSRYEQLVVTPEYQAYLAARTQQPQAVKPKEFTSEEKEAFKEKLNKMDRAEYAAFIRDLTVDTVRDQLFNPVVQTIVSDKVQSQIAEATTKYADFWDFKQEMIVLSNENPRLTAEQVYRLAKASRPNAPAEVKPPSRKPGGEMPTGTPAARTVTVQPGFDAAFEAAYKKAGL